MLPKAPRLSSKNSRSTAFFQRTGIMQTKRLLPCAVTGVEINPWQIGHKSRLLDDAYRVTGLNGDANA